MCKRNMLFAGAGLLAVALFVLPIIAADKAEPTVPAKVEAKACAAEKGCCKKVDQALTAVEAAIKATESGDKAVALAELNKAKDLLAAVKQAVKPAAAPVNAKCPIMGGKADPKLTRVFNGQTVGFCCAGCPEKWDKLTDEQKAAKLKEVAPASPAAPDAPQATDVAPAASAGSCCGDAAGCPMKK